MTGMTSLWAPVLLSAVFVFIASSILHMVIGWHRSDYRAIPNEDKVLDTFRAWRVPPGDYMSPCPPNRAAMNDPVFKEKLQKGPVFMMTIMPPGGAFAAQLAQWFVYTLVISAFAAYITGRAVGPGEEYLRVFRFAGATAFIGYSAALWQTSIWYRRSWLTTFKQTVDGLIYGLLTAGTFGWLWPR